VNTSWAGIMYVSSLTHDDDEGWTALELTSHVGDRTERVARVVFWDAAGQFSLEMFTDELPLVIIEELIAEAKRKIVVR
jgi:hypothetical protein